MDQELLAEKAAAVERHLRRVEARLAEGPPELEPDTDRTSVVVFHLWQATQVIIDLAMSLCVRRGRGTPPDYAESFRELARDGVIEPGLSERLAKAAGFRNVVVHTYQKLNLEITYEAARRGPADLRAFLAAVRDALPT